MSWFPIGPAFVFSPREPAYLRISRQNEAGAQGSVTHIAPHPTEADTIFAIDRPWAGGSAMHRSADGGLTWRSLLEPVHQSTDPNLGGDVDPTCLAFHPNVVGRMYLGTGDKQSLYVSTDSGLSWSFVSHAPGKISHLMIDPQTGADAAHLGTTEIYAATDNGLYHSASDGTVWDAAPLVGGDVFSLAARFPSAGPPNMYAGIRTSGLWHSSSPANAASWTNLSSGSAPLPSGASGDLPSYSAAPFDRLIVDYVRNEPQRVYLITEYDGGIRGLYRSDMGAAGPWTCVALGAALPGLNPNPECFSFAVSPNAPEAGGGGMDILFLGTFGVHRSHDGGVSWQDLEVFHGDVRSMALWPDRPTSVVPRLYVGDDGGIARSDQFADPGSGTTGDFNDGMSLDPSSPAYINLNRGKAGSSLFQMASDPRISSLSFIGCGDTGVAMGRGTLTWGVVTRADAGSIAVAPRADGVSIWAVQGLADFFPGFYVGYDVYDGTSIAGHISTFGATGDAVGSASNLILGPGDTCLGGLVSYVHATTTPSGVPSSSDPANVEITLGDLTGVETGTTISVDPDVEDRWIRTVDAIVDAATNRIRGYFAAPYPPGTPVKVVHSYVGTIDSSGVATRLSQNLGLWNHMIHAVAASPDHTSTAICATRRYDGIWGPLGPVQEPEGITDLQEHVYRTDSGTTTPSTWVEVADGAPAGFEVASLVVDRSGTPYVLLREPAAVGGITTPLVRLDGTRWTAIACAGAPAAAFFTKIVQHPTDDDHFFAAHQGRVYRLTVSGAAATWTDISDGPAGLPGTWVYDLWTGNVDTRPGHTKVILRAAVATRGVYERDITAGATERPIALYLRDNLVDQGWLDESPSGIPDPLRPTDRVWYWQCADIKVDLQHDVPPFYQTDPEWSPGPAPLPHLVFDIIKDWSQRLNASRLARVHARIHNRGRTPPAHPVSVVLLWTKPAAGLPALDSLVGGGTFSVWDHFAAGSINLTGWPVNAWWQPIGGVATVSGVTADNPVVVSRDWTVPALSGPSDPGHVCIVALVNSQESELSSFTGTDTSIDSINRRNPQVGQKNLHVVPVASGGPGNASGMDLGRVGDSGWTSHPIGIDFHNPTEELREATLVFDLRHLPPTLRVHFRLSGSCKPRRVSGAMPSQRHHREWYDRDKEAQETERAEPRLAYEAAPATRVEIHGVHLSPRSHCTATFEIRAGHELNGGEYRFDVLQMAKQEVVGGSTVLVRVGKQRRPRLQPLGDEDLEKIPIRLRRMIPRIFAPPSVEDIVAGRLKRL